MLIFIFRTCFTLDVFFFAYDFFGKSDFLVCFTLKIEPNHAFDAYFFLMCGCDFSRCLLGGGFASMLIFIFEPCFTPDAY